MVSVQAKEGEGDTQSNMDATAGFMSMGGGGGDRGDRGRKSPPPAFMFPVLKFTQITECLEELEIELTKAELSEPVRHRDRLKQMWLEVVRWVIISIRFFFFFLLFPNDSICWEERARLFPLTLSSHCFYCLYVLAGIHVLYSSRYALDRPRRNCVPPRILFPKMSARNFDRVIRGLVIFHFFEPCAS